MLSPGTRLGPYEVLGALGAGGMGEVVRARDTRLGRDVAIKTLPEAFAQDPERLQRFEREARLLATLHHPNIGAIFGVEEVTGRRHLVLELVEGPTLAERIDRGPLPLEEALDLARQIAGALEFAHEHGVIHRDLKPGNVKVTPGGEVKVLDFGLAKGATSGPSSSDLSNSPTVTAAPTGAGVILGTAAYMSPEQARGRAVDRRTDIWSFGCVLYEMLTGRQLFTGETVTDILARILQGEPDWSALPAGTPPRIRELLARCLRKDPKERLRDIGDARIEISEVLAAGPAYAEPGARGARRGAAWPVLAGALVLGAGVTAAALMLLAPKPEHAVRRFAIGVARLNGDFSSPPVISPDGRRIAYVASDQLFVRDLARFEVIPIPGTDGALAPAWSTASDQISFTKDGKLWVAPASGGPPSALCSIPDPGSVIGSCWLEGGSIVFALYRGGLYQVSSRGGDPRLILAPGKTEEDFHSPQALPGGERVLAVAHRLHGDFPIVVVSVRDGKRRDLGAFSNLLKAIWSPEGYLLLVRRQPSTIDAVRFTTAAARIEGEPVRLLPGGIGPSVSADGTLCYELDPNLGLRQMLWLDAHGHVLERLGDPQPGARGCQLSHDGRALVYSATEGDAGDIWLRDLARGIHRRVVADSNDKSLPILSPDGGTVYYSAFRSISTLWLAPVDGSSPPRSYGPGEYPVPSPDGQWLVYMNEEHGHESVWRRPVTPDGRPEPLWRSVGSQEGSPRVSHDGRWIAYASDESGQTEVYVRSYPAGAGKQLVSRRGGDLPFWAPGGEALYYTARDTLFRVPVRAGAAFSASEPQALFSRRDVGDDVEIGDVAADGRLIGSRRSLEDPRRGLLVVEHWSEVLRGR